MDPRFLQAYHDAEARHWWFRARRDLLVAMLESRLPEGGTVLDVGCGTGYFLDALRGRYDGRGLDFSEDNVAFCRSRGLSGVEQADAESLTRLQGMNADCVCFLDVLEHLDDDVAVLASAREVLRPGGTLLATVPAYRWLWSAHDDLNNHRRRYTRGALAEAVRRAGYEVDAVGYFNTLLFPLAVVQRLAARISPPTAEDSLRTPPAPLNAMLERLFRAERPALARRRPRGFPFGLSVFAVGRRPA